MSAVTLSLLAAAPAGKSAKTDNAAVVAAFGEALESVLAAPAVGVADTGKDSMDAAKDGHAPGDGAAAAAQALVLAQAGVGVAGAAQMLAAARVAPACPAAAADQTASFTGNAAPQAVPAMAPAAVPAPAPAAEDAPIPSVTPAISFAQAAPASPATFTTAALASSATKQAGKSALSAPANPPQAAAPAAIAARWSATGENLASTILASTTASVPAAAAATDGAKPVRVAPAPASGPESAQAFAQIAALVQAAPAAAASAPAASVPVPAGFTAQLAKPLFTVAGAGLGDHSMTVQMNPDSLGPVTVQAHISAGNISIEMFAGTADGRDVLRQALPELKRDLAGAGINASLDLSSNGQSGSKQGGQDREGIAPRPPADYSHTPNSPQLPVNGQTTRTRPGLYGPASVLDVMA